MTRPVEWTNEKRSLGELCPWERNPRQINSAEGQRLAQSLDEFGQVDVIAIGPCGEVYNGHQRLNVWMAEHGPAFEVDVRVASRALTEKEREKLTVFLHRGAVGEWDWDLLASWGNEDELLEWGFEPFELGILTDAAQHPDESIDDISSDLPGAMSLKPDMHFDSDLPWDIPELLPDMLLDQLPQPLDTWAGPDACVDDGITSWLYNWGSDSTRGLPFERTILAFYVDDQRFERFWSQPDVYVSKVLNAHIPNVVAPNFSLWSDAARATHLYNIFRSRWIGRYMQEAGLYTVPDVNWADQRSFDFCLLGIPHGVPIVAMQMQTIKTEAEISRAQSGVVRVVQDLDPGTLMVYGGPLSHNVARDALTGYDVNVEYVVNRVARRRAKIENTMKEVLR